MQISELPKDKIKAVFSDLDDTITFETKVSSQTYQDLWRLKEKGLRTVIVSGRPGGWADCLMRIWPIDAVIFENGAGIMHWEGEKLIVENLAKDKDLQQQKTRLHNLFDEIKKSVPDLKLAKDQPYRIFDYAIDFTEEPPRLKDSEIDFIMDFLGKQEDITAKLSSIHVNYWVGNHTKVTACEYLLKKLGSEWGISREQIVFSGDSPNDEPLFDYFDYSVGVANIKSYLDKLKAKPKYITNEVGGKGFSEIVQQLLI